MRRCPFCAEDIADDVSRCPYCGSDVSATPGSAGVAPAPGQAQGPPSATGGAQSAQATVVGPVRFSHTGQRYLLGYDASDFGIWDRASPAAPVERFPRSDEGWARAWRRYASLEPANQPVQAAASPVRPAGPQPATAPWAQYPQQGPYGMPGPYGMRAPRETNRMAIASLVLGLVGLFTFWLFAITPILAVIFGLVGRSQIRVSGGRQEGDGMAIAGLVLGIAGLVFFVIAVIVSVNRQNL